MVKALKFFLKYFFLSDNLRILKTIITISEYSGSLQRVRFLFDRVLFIFLIPLSIVFIRFKFLSKNSNRAIFIEPSGFSHHRSMYEFYMEKWFKKKVVHLHYKQGIFISKFVDFFSFLKLVCDSVSLLPFVFSLKNISFIEFWKTFVLEHNLRVMKVDEAIYIADYSSVCNYFLLLRNSRKYNLYFIPTNSSVFNYFRFLFLTDMYLVVLSPKIFEEISQLNKRGFIELNNVKFIHTGPLFELYQTNRNPSVIYDIAFYSSGEWARRGGVFRLDKLEEINAVIELGNIYNDVSVEIMRYLASYAKSNNLTFKVYLHPYEKYLLEKYNLKPPFTDLEDEGNVLFSTTEYSNLFEARLGIITISSVLFDRESYGLDSFYYLEDPPDCSTVFYKRDQFSNNANGFLNLIELEKKLIKYFD